MVRFTVLASGSKGNSTVVSGGRTRILVDAGLSCRELFRRMKLAGEDPETLDAIVITHEHQDHVNGLAVTARKLGIPVYFTEATHRAWMRWLTPRRQMTYAQWLELCRKQAAERQAEPEAGCQWRPDDEDDPEEAEADSQTRMPSGPLSAAELAEPRPRNAGFALEPPSLKDDPTWLPAVEYFQAGEPFSIGDIDLSPFTIPHDAADPVGFVFSTEGIRLGFATDLGYITAQRQGSAPGLDLAASRIESRSGDASRRALSLAGQAEGSFARRPSLQRCRGRSFFPMPTTARLPTSFSRIYLKTIIFLSWQGLRPSAPCGPGQPSGQPPVARRATRATFCYRFLAQKGLQ